jgi:hypothetical protein
MSGRWRGAPVWSAGGKQPHRECRRKNAECRNRRKSTLKAPAGYLWDTSRAPSCDPQATPERTRKAEGRRQNDRKLQPKPAQFRGPTEGNEGTKESPNRERGSGVSEASYETVTPRWPPDQPRPASYLRCLRLLLFNPGATATMRARVRPIFSILHSRSLRLAWDKRRDRAVQGVGDRPEQLGL